jgi:hypothetical protein
MPSNSFQLNRRMGYAGKLARTRLSDKPLSLLFSCRFSFVQLSLLFVLA